ncbi:hypothetical protein CRYUN_Cryun01aG0201300 [Craigia yunnanensis]
MQIQENMVMRETRTRRQAVVEIYVALRSHPQIISGLTAIFNYSCAQKGVDCKPIQPGGTCFHPNTTICHASYAMNLFYKAARKNTWNCHFSGTGLLFAGSLLMFERYLALFFVVAGL